VLAARADAPSAQKAMAHGKPICIPPFRKKARKDGAPGAEGDGDFSPTQAQMPGLNGAPWDWPSKRARLCRKCSGVEIFGTPSGAFIWVAAPSCIVLF
jgi:hypothetical protein